MPQPKAKAGAHDNTFHAQPQSQNHLDRQNENLRLCFWTHEPPHAGHQRLIDRVDALAKHFNAESRIYLSCFERQPQDPLPLDRKLHWANLSLPNSHIYKAIGEGKYPKDSLASLNMEGFEQLLFVCGSDRADLFHRALQACNGTKLFNFHLVNLSVIHRKIEEDGDLVKSGTTLRKLAQDNNFPEFASGLSRHLAEAEKESLFHELRAALLEASSAQPGRQAPKPS